MVELQLEKLSPIPLAQAVWTAMAVGPMTINLQSVVVVILPRVMVETCLGSLEKEGYQPDRLELPLLDQLLATPFQEDGVWIYEDKADAGRFLSVWWSNGLLQHLSLHSLGSAADPGGRLVEQLTQIAWTGELDGWLAGTPKWHFVADPRTAAEWEAIFRPLTTQSIEVIPPVEGAALAARTARRAVDGEQSANLLPDEYSIRYRQQFVDQLWMRALAGVIGLYLVGLVVYFAALGALAIQDYRVSGKYGSLSGAYTNAVRMRDRVAVLEQQSHLKFAALDCWKTAAELLPKEMTLTSMTIQKGRKFTLYGTVPQDSTSKITDYNEALANSSINGERLVVESPRSQPPHVDPTGVRVVAWDFSCQIGKKGVE